jgi:tRNA(fMet)-specific endonuclease VapC
LMRGRKEVSNLLDSADEVYVPSIAIGELLAGFKRGNSEQRNKEVLARFLDLSRVGILSIDEDSAERYSVILDYLRLKGSPIPTNDIWIAACAMQYGLILISSDQHFLNLPQIVTEFLESK